MIQNLALAQFIAYVCLTITSVIVATVSLRFSYRQNFGWRPIMLISRYGLEGTPKAMEGKTGFDNMMTINFEVWNRHTYPIVISQAKVKIEQDILDHNKSKTTEHQRWYIGPKGECSYLDRLVVKNGEHLEYVLRVPLKDGQSLDDIDSKIHINVGYFDPRRDKRRTLELTHRFKLR